MGSKKNYGLGKDTYKSKHYRVRRYKGPKLAMGKVINKSQLKAGKKNKLGLG